jgi:hypothetical protein
MKEYNRARNDGMRLALTIVDERGIEGLRKELRFREKNKINTNLTMQELEEASKPMRGFINEGQILIWLSVLHDEFDFGKNRLNRAMDRFEAIYDSISEGYAGYSDYIEMLQKKMKRVLKTEYLIQDDQYKKAEDK